MSDADFFNPPADGAPAFAAAPPEDSYVGEVQYAAPTDSSDSAAFFNPPVAEAPAETPIVLVPDQPVMDFAAAPTGVVEDVADDDDGGLMAPAPVSMAPPEPSAMQKWNEEWQTTLLQRKEEENALKATQVEAARADIEKFQAEREKRRETRMAKNRSDEQDKLEAIEADLENDNSWQRVVKMIELNQDSADGSADTNRMKDVLVLLKNEPGKAAALTA